MAKFGGGREPGKAAWLRARVMVFSTFAWKLDVLEARLYAALGLKKEYEQLELEKVEEGNNFVAYSVSWRFDLGYTGIADENEKHLQRDAETVCGVFAEMEEKVKAARAVEDPLNWLEAGEETELIEACCGGPQCLPTSNS